jgi:hypothetical protein
MLSKPAGEAVVAMTKMLLFWPAGEAVVGMVKAVVGSVRRWWGLS